MRFFGCAFLNMPRRAQRPFHTIMNETVDKRMGDNACNSIGLSAGASPPPYSNSLYGSSESIIEKAPSHRLTCLMRRRLVFCFYSAISSSYTRSNDSL